MARKKTKKQKQLTSQRTQKAGSITALSYNLDTLSEINTLPKKIVAPTSTTTENLYAYDPELIKSDLNKTLVISGLMIVIQLGFFLWLG